MQNKKIYSKRVEYFIRPIGIFLFFFFSMNLIGATPVMSIMFPEEGGIYGPPTTWTGINLNHDGAVTCEYSSDNVTWYSFTFCDDTFNYIPVEGINQTLYVRGTGSEEDIGYAAPVTFTYDTISPSIEITFPLQGETYDKNTWTGIILNYDDAVACEYYDSANSIWYSFTSCDNTSNYIPHNGSNQVIYVRGEDGANNAGYSIEVTFTYSDIVYNITTCEELQGINNDLSGNYILMNNINCSDSINWDDGNGFLSIGSGDGSSSFIGNFDGRGYDIIDLYINRESELRVGLFAWLSGTVSNVNLNNVNITGTEDVGGLIGEVSGGGNIVNVNVSGDVTAIDEYEAGGLVGANSNGNIKNCHSSVNVNGLSSIGGLAGYSVGTITNCSSSGNVNGLEIVGGLIGKNYGDVYDSYATGNIFGTFNYIGGLVGGNYGDIYNSYATGNVEGLEIVGGLTGYSESGTIENSYAVGNIIDSVNITGGLIGYIKSGVVNSCYATGNIINNLSKVGGLIGSYNSGNITNSFWDIQTSGLEISAGGTGKTTLQMKSISTYTKENWSSGLTRAWDFVGNPLDDTENINIWNLDSNGTINQGYPFFATLETIVQYNFNDTISPIFTIIPLYKELFYENESLLVQFEGIDDIKFGSYSVNDTINFDINQTGFLSNKTSLLIGNYELNVTINDTSNNINWTIFNIGVKEDPYVNFIPVVPRSSGGGGGGSSRKIVAVEDNKTNQSNETSQSASLYENKSKNSNPLNLFDIKLEIDSAIIKDLSELTSVITFTSFGSIPTEVNLTYVILNSSENEIYREKGNVTVTTEQIVRNNFESLNLPAGKYSLILTTVYGENVTDDFRQEFSVADKIQNRNWIIYLLIGLIGVFIIVFLVTIYARYRTNMIYTSKEKVEGKF